ncbi:MAG TPA: helix-turn-helix transcriptional regulator [Jatrophihabitantaceae bacterium]
MRALEILRMVSTGLAARQIAERLVVSHRTVQNHIQNTLRKPVTGRSAATRTPQPAEPAANACPRAQDPHTAEYSAHRGTQRQVSRYLTGMTTPSMFSGSPCSWVLHPGAGTSCSGTVT